MEWEQVIEDPELQRLPYKIELDERGHLIMNAIRVNHSRLQGKILTLLSRLMPEGEAVVELAISTPSGVRSADVAWMTDAQVRTFSGMSKCPQSSALCIEVISPGNTPAEMAEKRILFFSAGAQEVWFCTEAGDLMFYEASGILNSSKLFPTFPNHLDI